MESSEKSASLDAVYKKRLLDLFRNPSGQGTPPGEALRGWAKNRTCGDEVAFFTRCAGENVKQCWQQAAGCAITTATGSLLVDAMRGKTASECRSLLANIRAMVFEGEKPDLEGELPILSAVHALPSRHECVGVALIAAERSLDGRDSGPP